MVWNLVIPIILTKQQRSLHHIAEMYFDDLKDLLQSADYFSVFCVGSTDHSETEKETIMIKILDTTL